MNPALDIVSDHAAELARREHLQTLSSDVVQSLFRLVRQLSVHTMDNQAMLRQLKESANLVESYSIETGHNVTILFSHGSVFIGGQLLRANRSVYQGALELGDTLRKYGVSEVTLSKDAREADLQAFAMSVRDASRGKRSDLPERPSPRVRLRSFAQLSARKDYLPSELPAKQAVVRTYASAIVVMRRHFEEVRKGKLLLPRKMKRVAQRLVDLSAGETAAFLGVTTTRSSSTDDAGRSVNIAVLALTMARRLTSDPLLLERLALAALVLEAGKARLVGGGGFARRLSEDEEKELPASTAVVFTSQGRVSEPAVVRTVIAFEAQWLRQRDKLGAVYAGLRPATLLSRILACAAAYFDLVEHAPEGDAGVDQVISELQARTQDPADRTVLRMLISALGVFPVGTLVELSTRETGLVVGASPSGKRHLPRVRLVLDASGGLLRQATELDLAEPSAGKRRVTRVVAWADDPAAASLRAAAEQMPASQAPPSGPEASSGLRGTDQVTAQNRLQAEGVLRPTRKMQAIEAPEPERPAIALAPEPPPPVTPPPEPVRRRAPEPRAEAAPRTPPARTPPPEPRRAVPDDDEGGATRSVNVAEQAKLLAQLRGSPAGPAVAPPSQRSSDPGTPPPSRRSAASGTRTIPGWGPLPAAPNASGTFQKTPLAHLLVYVLDRKLSGTAVFYEPTGPAHGLYFDGGVPAKARLSGLVWPLDRVLLDLKLADEATLRSSLLDVSKKKMLHGRALVMKGVLTVAQVREALRSQLLRKLTSLAELPRETAYEFYDGVNLIDAYGGPELFPLEPLSTLMSCVRARGEDPVVDATLARAQGRPLGLHPDADVPRFELQREERSIVDLLRVKRMTLEELCGAGVAQERVVRLVVYALLITRHIDVGKPPVGVETIVRDATPAPARETPLPARDEPRPAVEPPTAIPRSAPEGPKTALSATDVASAPKPRPVQVEMRSAPPVAAPEPARPAKPAADPGAAPKPDVEARRRDIEARAETIEDEDLYQVLGVEKTADANAIQAAYLKLVRTWHPDRLPPALAEVRPLVAKVFARIAEAQQTLTDPEKRKEYDGSSGGGGASEEEAVSRAVNAAFEFQKAEVLLKKNDLLGAEALARSAALADPEQPEYLTLLTWIQALRRGEDATQFDDLIKIFDGIVTKEPRFDRALFYRATLQKRMGRHDKALRDFRQVVQLNPKNLDAVREVRLAEMRNKERPGGPSAPTGGGQGGLFGKIFKK